MDEAFKSIGATILELVDQEPVVGGEQAGQRVIMTAINVELPIQLDLQREADGGLSIGSTPPLYALRTSVMPTFHQLRVRASIAPETEHG